jgi:DNA-binding transcriptional regulator YdaS (Cro superfamily)
VRITNWPYQRVIATVKGRYQLARALGISPQAIYGWRRVPGGRVLQVEELTGIPRSELRPDLYPPEREPEYINGRARKSAKG